MRDALCENPAVRALVTGGAGFIGSTLVDRLLAEGHAVDVVDDLSVGSLANIGPARAAGGTFSFHHLDVRAPELVDLVVLRRPDVVYHLARRHGAQRSIGEPVEDAEVNVLGSLHVLEGARLARARKIVFATSAATLYGHVEPRELPVAELHAYRSTSPHGVATRAVLDYLALYRELHGIEYTALALGSVYGPRADPSDGGVTAVLSADLLAGRRPTISGDGEQTRDFVYIDDVVDALSRAAERGSGLVLNISTGLETSINGLFRSLSRTLGSSVAPLHGPRHPGEIGRFSLDPTRAAIHLGWKHWTGLEEGIELLLEALGARTGRPAER